MLTNHVLDPRTSEAAKEHAREVLDNMGTTEETTQGGETTLDEHEHRVLGGYRATISSEFWLNPQLEYATNEFFIIRPQYKRGGQTTRS